MKLMDSTSKLKSHLITLNKAYHRTTSQTHTQKEKGKKKINKRDTLGLFYLTIRKKKKKKKKKKKIQDISCWKHTVNVY